MQWCTCDAIDNKAQFGDCTLHHYRSCTLLGHIVARCRVFRGVPWEDKIFTQKKKDFNFYTTSSDMQKWHYNFDLLWCPCALFFQIYQSANYTVRAVRHKVSGGISSRIGKHPVDTHWGWFKTVIFTKEMVTKTPSCFFFQLKRQRKHFARKYENGVDPHRGKIYCW